MIKTKTAIKREKRDEQIVSSYKELMSLDGAMKSAVVETISRDLKTSITTVNRVVKPIK
jgi:predicted transcriptional regulator